MQNVNKKFFFSVFYVPLWSVYYIDYKLVSETVKNRVKVTERMLRIKGSKREMYELIPVQLSPLQCPVHWQVNPTASSTHVPPFAQGELSQASTSEK